MSQINPSVTNPTISDIYEKIKSGKLDLSPDFQRKFVWTQEHQEEFIDTIMHGYPFPEIYVCTAEFDYENMQTSQKVIDGQQRLTTIKNYIDNNFKNNTLKKIRPFSDLDSEAKKQFMSYKLVVRDIGEVNDTLVREIFRRINLTKFKLEDIEIHNAVYDGEFIKTAKEILEKAPKDAFNIFHESELTRMSDLHFILQVMATIENGGYYARDSEMENMISFYNENYTNSITIKEKILSSFEKIRKLELPDSSIWLRKSNFFTMIVELTSCENMNLSNDELKTKLLDLEEKIIEDKSKDNEFGKYYSAMYTGTNNRTSRITRADLFKKYILVNNN